MNANLQKLLAKKKKPILSFMRGPVYLNSSDPSELTSKKIYKFISDFSKDICATPTCDLLCIAS